MRHIVYVKVHFELMKCINDQLTRLKHASRSAAEASIYYGSRAASWSRSLFYSLLPLRVYEWSKIRVTSKFASEMKSKNLPPTSQHFAAHLNKHNNLQQPTHAHCPYHDVLALLPVDQPSMSTTLLLASLRVERHRLQLLLLSLKDCNWKHTENRHHHAAIIRRY